MIIPTYLNLLHNYTIASPISIQSFENFAIKNNNKKIIAYANL